MAVIDLASVEQVKGYLGINSSVDDALLERLVKAASAHIQRYLNRELGQATYTEKRNGTDGETMSFRNFPVTAVSAVTVNDQSIPLSTGAFVPGYVYDATTISLRGHKFWRGKLNVSLTYTAGYTDQALPADITQACVELIALRYKEKDRIGVTNKGLAGEAVGFSDKDMANSTRSALQQYRRVVPL